MRKLIHLTLGGLLLTQAAVAAGPDETLRQNLTSPVRPIAGLQRIQATSEREPRVGLSSSFFFKGLLRNVESDLLSLKKMGKPIVVDPSMSLQDLEAKIQAQEDHVCNQALNKLPGGIDALLTTVMFQLMDSSANDSKLAPGDAKVTSPAEQQLLLGLVKTHLAAAPEAAKGLKLKSIIGEPTKIDFHGSVTRRIQFTRKNTDGIESRLPMSFSMLASYRTGRDEVFVKVQSCLVSYLKAQQQLFGKRVSEIDAGNKPKTANMIINDAGLTNTKTSNIHFETLKPNQAEAYVLKHFLEGRIFTGLTQEKEFMTERLAKISASLPYLEERLKGALEAHQLMSRMSTKQMDDLIGMFLQLMEKDLPTPELMNRLNAEARTEAGQTQAFAEKFVYYKQLMEDLTNLERALIEEKISNEATKQDLEDLRLKARP